MCVHVKLPPPPGTHFPQIEVITLSSRMYVLVHSTQ